MPFSETKSLGTCPAINSTSIMTVTCTLNEQTLKSCADAFDGTVARFQCARYFENQGQEKDPFRLCSNGRWVGSLPTCVPRKFVKITRTWVSHKLISNLHDFLKASKTRKTHQLLASLKVLWCHLKIIAQVLFKVCRIICVYTCSLLIRTNF